MSESTTHKRHYSRSLFGPIVLIAIGVYFLLANMGMVQSPNWVAVLQLWPLWLIFLGVNIIVQQAPRPLGGFLSALVGLTAVAVFGYVLLFSEDNPLLHRLGVSGQTQVQIEEISFPAQGVETAVIELDFGSPGARVYALENSNQLIAGQVSYVGELIFDTAVSRGQAAVFLDTRSSSGWTFWADPGNWAGVGQTQRWQIGLNPDVPMELRLDPGSGAVDLDLSQLTLTDLQVDGGSGRIDLQLPPGEYDVIYNARSGASRITLPANGRFNVTLDGGSGNITLYLPRGMEARIEVDSGSGSFNPDGRFRLVSGDRNRDDVWETEGYEDAPNRIELRLDMGSGSVSIRE